MDPLIRLTYRSVQHPSVSEVDIRSILVTARRNNPLHGITGFLAYTATGFLQALEGPRSAVNRAYAAIVRDARHADAVILSYGAVDSRLFQAWTMGYVALGAGDRSLLMRYAADADGSLKSVSPGGADLLLQELAVATAVRVTSRADRLLEPTP